MHNLLFIPQIPCLKSDRQRLAFSVRLALRIHLVVWLCLCASGCVVVQVCVLLLSHVELVSVDE
jgi:hypothetical protein